MFLFLVLLMNLHQKLLDQPIDIFINNAGVFGPRNNELENFNVKEWLDVFNINTIAPLLTYT